MLAILAQRWKELQPGAAACPWARVWQMATHPGGVGRAAATIGDRIRIRIRIRIAVARAWALAGLVGWARLVGSAGVVV